MERPNDVFSFQSRLPIYGSRLSRSLRRTCVDSVDFVQRLRLEKTLDVHQGCVNSISWNETGSVILSGSDDKKLCITDPFSRKVLARAVSGHRSNIFSAQFLPFTQNNQIVSCSGDGQISYTIVDREDTHGTNMFLCHYGTTYEVATVPGDPHTFLSCGEDGSVRWFDLRAKTNCTKDRCKSDILINCRRAVTTLAVNPMQPYHLAVGCSDSSVRVFDRRVLGTRAQGSCYSGRGIQAMFCRLCPPHMKKKYSRPTSLNYDRDGEEILVSYSTDYIYCFNLRDEDEERKSAIEVGEGAPEARSKEGGDSVNPVKRLRLRGDWSDTGPKARPRSERSGEEDPPPRISIVQRMSEMLSRWLEDTTPQHARSTREETRRLSVPDHRSEGQQGVSSPRSTDYGTLGVSSRSQEERVEDAAIDDEDRSGGGNNEDNPTSPSRQASASSKERLEGDSSPKVLQSEDSQTTAHVQQREDRHRGDSSRDVGPPSDVETTGEAVESTTGKTSDTVVDFKEKKRKKSEDEVTDHRTSSKGSQGQQGASREVNEIKKSRKSSREGRSSEEGQSFREGESSKDRGLSEREKEPPVKEGESSWGRGSSRRGTWSGEGKSPKGERLSGVKTSEEVQSPVKGASCGENEPFGEMQSPGDGQSVKEGSDNSDDAEVGLSDIEMEEEEREETDDKSNDKERNDSKGRDERCDTPLALKERQEDWNPKDRTTKQFADPSTRRRKVSVSGIPGQEPDAVPSSSGQGQSSADTQRAQTRAEESVSDIRSRFESGNVRPASRPRPRRVSPSRRIPHFRREVLVNADEMDISDTDSDFDSDDDLVLRRPRRSSSSTDESRDHEAALREGAAASKSSRLKELFKNHRMRKEKEEEEMLRNVKSPKIKMVYKGHRNSRTMIKEATFWGSNHVLSGSDCGHVFIWDRHTGKLVMLLEGDRHVVNCIQPHPTEPILATSGIDYDIKIWGPLADEPRLPSGAEEVIRINELMLEETRDTITIPPSFMLRMLASLNHLRTDSRATGEAPDSDSSEG